MNQKVFLYVCMGVCVFICYVYVFVYCQAIVVGKRDYGQENGKQQTVETRQALLRYTRSCSALG